MRLSAARAAWLMFTAAGLLLLAIGLPLHWAQWATVCSGADCGVGQLTARQAQQLPSLGLSLPAWASIFTILWNLEPLAGLAIAALIFRRRPNDGMALFTCFVLVAATFGGSADYATTSLVLKLLENLYTAAGDISLALLLFVFPDGRFVPRWTRWLLPVPFLVEILTGVLPWSSPVANAASGGLLLLLGLLQIYRYQRVSNPVQRQQTKWVVYLGAIGLSVQAVGGFFLTAIYPLPSLSAAANLAAFVLFTPFLLLFPLSIAIAILRSRLWDIDLLIRRTLIYSVLTALLALVYFGSVVALQNLFITLTGQQRSELVTVLSTLAIAALFVPIRSRVQRVIDHRFYRRKYDTARTLAAFSQHVRDQVELDRLTDELLTVVNTTMQPAQLSLWLPQPETLDLKGLKDL